MELNLNDEERLVEVSITPTAIITARMLPVHETLALGKRHTRTKIKRGVPVEKTDEKAFAEDLWDRTIHSWKGFTSAGQEIPCTRANKFKMMSKYPEIAEKLNEAIEIVREKTFEEERSAEQD